MLISCRAGDHAHSRAPFHILIALCAGPRFLVLVLQWLSHRQTKGTDDSASEDDRDSSAQSSGRQSRSTRSTSRKAEELVDQVVKPAYEAVREEGGPKAPLADIELGVGLARTFCW
jgi:hypothetical protein